MCVVSVVCVAVCLSMCTKNGSKERRVKGLGVEMADVAQAEYTELLLRVGDENE